MKLSTAILISLVAHAALVALLMANFQFSPVEIKQSGTPQPQINAKAINSKRVEQLVSKLKQERLSKKREQEKRLQALKQAEEKARRKRLEEEKKAEDARKRRKKAEQTRIAEEEKVANLKKKRIKDEKARKKKAEAEKKRKAEADRKKKAEAEKRRKAKAEAERKRKAAEEKARMEAMEREMQAQMDAEAAELNAAHRQQVLNEVDKYVTLIRGKIYRNWIEPEHAGYCIYKLQVSPGGLVIGLSVVEGDPMHCESGQRAIYKSEPLPVSKDPDVFAELKSINLTLGEKKTNE